MLVPMPLGVIFRQGKRIAATRRAEAAVHWRDFWVRSSGCYLRSQAVAAIEFVRAINGCDRMEPEAQEYGAQSRPPSSPDDVCAGLT